MVDIETEDRSPRTQSLTAQAYSRLRAEIISCALPPGAKLKIEELRESLGIGASPLREALSQLTAENLVERIDNRGFRVSHVGEEDFEELLRTRCWLEERGLREAIARGGADWEEKLVLADFRLERIPRSASREAFVANPEWERLHRAYHMMLISACGSQRLTAYCGQLYDLNIRYRHLAGFTAYPVRDVGREHAEITRAALDRDADAAVALLIAHYTRTGQYLKRAIGRLLPDPVSSRSREAGERAPAVRPSSVFIDEGFDQ